jgi:hypothetical protein
MQHPGMLGKDASAELDDVTQRFPFFQSAQLLYIKSLHNENNFLYNNQLKVAATYAVNRKVLYELITKKEVGSRKLEAGDQKIETPVKTPAVANETVETHSNASPENRNASSEKEIISPKFPKKKLTSDPDEWESGMMRQLQLLHHWKTSPEEILRQRLQEIEAEKNLHKKPGENIPTPLDANSTNTTEKIEEKTPSATDEINTLLYVLVEPDGGEDVQEEEEVKEETSWEVNELESAANTESVEVPEDNVEQEIIREAITSSIELEVDDTLPSLEELTGAPKKTSELKIDISTSLNVPNKLAEKKPVPRIEVQPKPEEQNVNSSEEVSFGAWLTGLKKPTIQEEKSAPQAEGNKLIEKFIKEEPRIKPSKTAFYNPVNMARKSVQESDEFLTETLARIYAKQGNIPKAIRAYQKLSLKFPEKTVYFAALIEELKRTPTK